MSNCTNCGARIAYDTPSCQYCGTQLRSAPQTPVSHDLSEPELRLDDIASGPYPRGSFGRRVMAAIIDVAIAMLLLIPFSVSMMRYTNTHPGVNDMPLKGWLWFSLPLIYLTFKDGLLGGRSLGKVATGMLVVDTVSQQPCGILKSAGRNLGSGATAFVPFGPLIDCILALTDAEGRKVGDRLAKTQVINANDFMG